jgi:hypothetical protein
MGRDAGWFPAALVVAVAFVAPAQEKPPAPRVLLIAGEEGDADDSEIAASELARLLADRHGMKTTQVRAHSAEIGRALDALPDTDVAVLLVRSRTWPEKEQRRLADWVAKGGKLVDLFAPPENLSLKKVLEQPVLLREFMRGVYRALGRAEPATVDVTLPETTPLPEFDVSTAYVSDWSQPIAKQVFPPEEGIGGFNDVNWIHVRSPDGALDLRRFDPNSKQGTIYVKSTLTVKGKRDLELVLQSDDGLEVFVDGKKRASRQEVRTLHSGCDLVPVTLEDGEHELLLKVMNAGDAWAVRARVRDLTAYRAGKPK